MVASGSNNDDNILFVSGCVVCLLSKGVFPTVRHIQKPVFVLVFGINAAHGSAVKENATKTTNGGKFASTKRTKPWKLQSRTQNLDRLWSGFINYDTTVDSHSTSHTLPSPS